MRWTISQKTSSCECDDRGCAWRKWVPVIHGIALGVSLGGGGGLRLAAPGGLVQVRLTLRMSCMYTHTLYIEHQWLMLQFLELHKAVCCMLRFLPAYAENAMIVRWKGGMS